MKKSLGKKTIVFPTPVFLIGSYDAHGRPNVMTASWAGICCSQPPCVMVALRAATHTYANIMRSREFTLNVPSRQDLSRVDYVGMVSGRDLNKFVQADFTPVRSDVVNAPYVEECPLIVECQVVQSIKLGLHTQFIGEIKDVKADQDVLGPGGHPLVEQVAPFIFAPGVRRYYAVGKSLGEAFSAGRARSQSQSSS